MLGAGPDAGDERARGGVGRRRAVGQGHRRDPAPGDRRVLEPADRAGHRGRRRTRCRYAGTTRWTCTATRRWSGSRCVLDRELLGQVHGRSGALRRTDDVRATAPAGHAPRAGAGQSRLAARCVDRRRPAGSSPVRARTAGSPLRRLTDPCRLTSVEQTPDALVLHGAVVVRRAVAVRHPAGRRRRGRDPAGGRRPRLHRAAADRGHPGGRRIRTTRSASGRRGRSGCAVPRASSGCCCGRPGLRGLAGRGRPGGDADPVDRRVREPARVPDPDDRHRCSLLMATCWWCAGRTGRDVTLQLAAVPGRLRRPPGRAVPPYPVRRRLGGGGRGGRADPGGGGAGLGDRWPRWRTGSCSRPRPTVRRTPCSASRSCPAGCR